MYVTAPLVKIKQAMASLKKEITQMDIRIGVIQHILLQAKLKEKTSHNRPMAVPDDADDDNYDYQGGF